MSCTEHQRTINRFVDHEIKATGCAELFEHLGACEGCRQFYDAILTVGAEMDKVYLPIDGTSTASSRSSRQPTSHMIDTGRIAPRRSTLAFILMAVFLVGLLFSVNVTIEKPTPPAPFSAVGQ